MIAYPGPDKNGYPFNPFAPAPDDSSSSKRDLPDYKEEDRKMKEKLQMKYEAIKAESIKKSTDNFYRRLSMFKLILSIAALLVAFLFVFIFPGSGWETAAITIVAGVSAQLGITNWRVKYEMAKDWFKSKTIVGALVVVIPLVILAVLNFFSFGIPSWISQIITWILMAGGGTALSGIIDAANNPKKAGT